MLSLEIFRMHQISHLVFSCRLKLEGRTSDHLFSNISLFPFLSFCDLFSFVFSSSSYFLISFALIMPLHLNCFFLSLGVILFCIPLLALSCPVIIHALPSNLCSLRISMNFWFHPCMCTYEAYLEFSPFP